MNYRVTQLSDAEVWLGVAGWRDLYEVSSHGRIRSLDRYDRNGQLRRGRILKPGHTDGYPSVVLHRDGTRKTFKVHYLVCRAFGGPKPSSWEVRHLDGNRANCRADNLAWGTSRMNSADALEHGTTARGDRLAKYNAADFERITDLCSAGLSQQAIADHTGIAQSTVSRVLLGVARRQPKVNKFERTHGIFR